MSEQIFLVNPRTVKRHRKGRMPAGLARYWATHRRKLRTPHRAKSRRRPAHRASGYTVGTRRIRRRKLNPIRRHHARARVHHRMRHRRSNPRFFGMGNIVRGTLMPAAIGAGGAIALDVAMGFATPYLPATLQSGYFPVLVKLAGALAIGYVAGKALGRERGRVATLGAVTVVAYGAIKPLIAQNFPSLKLSGYADFVDYSVGARPAGIGAYLPNPQMAGLGFTSPAAVIQQPSLYTGDTALGAYQPRGAMQMAGGLSGLGDPSGYDWRSDGM